MSKRIASRLASRFVFVLALTVLALTSHTMQAQGDPTPPPPTIVTGGDPQPIGKTVTILTILLPILVATIP